MIRAGVVGASGFLGSEVVRLLLGHPGFEVVFLAGRESAGQDLADVRPGFRGQAPLPIRDASDLTPARDCDVVFLALPHGHSAPVAEELLREGVTVIDLGSDFRIRDRAVAEATYQREAPREALLAAAFYCLPELTGPPPSDGRLIACPGCFATGLNLLLTPLDGVADSSVNVFGVTGSSGSGINPGPGVHHSLRTGSFTGYKHLSHQHEGEVRQLLASHAPNVDFRFVPHSGPFVRGIHLTAIVDGELGAIREAYWDRYQGKAGITVSDGPVALGAVVGTNRVDIGLAGSGSGAVSVTLAMDNLLKGGSGQAVQIANLRFGLPEHAGLSLIGAWP